jgi:hypothetical protein
MVTHLDIGAVLHLKNFRFDDGGTANKYFVVLGAKQARNWLLAIATSQQKLKQYTMGCHEKDGYYHIPGGGRDFFKLETWILLMECREVRPAEALKLLIDRTLTVEAILRCVELALAI